MKRSNGPCNISILATRADGTVKRMHINGTRYGTARHVARWLARGFHRVTVWSNSASTGKNIHTETGTAPCAQ